MQTNVKRLQQQYPLFNYVGFEHHLVPGGLEISFAFELGEHKFFPRLLIAGITEKHAKRLDQANLEHLIFNLGLAEIPSYWKLTCSPKIRIQAGYLNPSEVAFWQKLIEKGMGEFFFVNDIVPFAPQIEIEAKVQKREALPPQPSSDKVLVPVGGGKDSIVTMELLKRAGKDLTLFTIGKDEASDDIIAIFKGKYGSVPQLHIERILDPKLLELNARGYLNGHTPFSSVVAFESLFTAILFRLPNIALSNERSANEETGVYQGVNINHQYSKTFEFETDFRAYVASAFPSSPTYFSFLRPLYEIQIMRLFSRMSEYFSVFRSCNIGKKTNSWCGDCAKCLFVSLLLSAFLPASQVTAIFGKDLLSDPELVPLLKQLTGDAPMKAFECVGTREETMSALYLTWKRRRTEATLPVVIASYEEYLRSREQELATRTQVLLQSFDENHAVPKSFVKVVQDAV